MRVEVLVDVKTKLGEGPLWDVETQRLYWLDSVGRTIFRTTADGREVRAWSVTERVGSMALRRNGGAIIAQRDGFHFLDLATGDLEPVIDPEPDKPGNCLNDGKVDRRGRFVVGSMDMSEEAPTGAIYALDPDLTVRKLDEGIIVSNGPCWSPDDKTFYFQDSWRRQIWAYDYDVERGIIGDRRVFTSLSAQGGVADGSTVDAEGYLWNAQIFDGKIVRYTPEGEIDREVILPVRKVTSMSFGGPNLDILFVTSMGEQLLPHFPPDGIQRGSLFAVYGLGVRGLPEPRFAG